jgi:hypothetical protein
MSFKEICVGDYALRFYPSDNGWMCGITPEMMEALTAQPTKIFGPNLEQVLNSAGFYKAKKQESTVKESLQVEPVAWKNAAIRLGEELSSVGPDGYYDMNAEQWLTWAMDQQPRGKNSLAAPPQRQPLTDNSIAAIATEINGSCHYDDIQLARAIERAHGIGGEA